MSQYHLAQLNIARLKAPMDSPFMADFVANLDRINTLAEDSPGFVWRLKDDSGDATALRPFEDDIIVNMSVWTDVAALSDYAFKSAHVEILRRRREWFDRMEDAYMVLWWIPAGHTPTTTEARERLEHFRQHGATPHAFSFRQAYPAPDTPNAAQAQDESEACPAE